MMRLKDKFITAAAGFGAGVLMAAGTATVCSNIPRGSWLAVHNVDIAAQYYGSLVAAPVSGLIVGGLTGLAAYKRLRKDEPAP